MVLPVSEWTVTVVDEVWTGMRPYRLRERMDAGARS